MHRIHHNFLSGFSLKGFLLGCGVTLGFNAISSAPAMAQTFGQASSNFQTSQPKIPQYRVPDENTLARLVWTTMITLDNANRTGNYSMLYDLGSPDFQRSNSPDRLAANFAPLRNSRVDVGRTVLSTPTYYIPPQVNGAGQLRLRGGFDFRPQSIRFDLLYTQQNGGWQITALSVVEMDAATPKN